MKRFSIETPRDPLFFPTRSIFGSSRLPNSFLAFFCLAVSIGAISSASGQEGKALDGKISELRKALASDRRETRVNAAMEAAKMGASGRPLLPELLDAFVVPSEHYRTDDGSARIRECAWAAGTAIVKSAPPAFVIDCYSKLRDLKPDSPVRDALCDLIGRLYRPGDKALNKALGQIVSDPRDPVRLNVVGLIIAKGPINEAIPGLIDLLKAGDDVGQVTAAMALSRFDSTAADALPELDRIQRNEKRSNDARGWAISAMGSIGADRESMVPFFCGILTDPKMKKLQCAAIGAVAKNKFGQKAIPALLRIAEQLDPGDIGETIIPYVLPAAALGAVRDLDPRREDLPPLIRILERRDVSDMYLTSNLLDALARLGPDAAPALPALERRLLSAPNTQNSSEFADAFAAILGTKKAHARIAELAKDLDEEGMASRLTHNILRGLEAMEKTGAKSSRKR